MRKGLSYLAIAGLTCALIAGCRGPAGNEATGSDGSAPNTLLLGTTAPLTGPYAVNGLYVQGAKAYFDYVNEQGGVKMADGTTRKIEFKFYDDAYDPARALSNCRQFVEQDHGFAMVLISGTPTGLACADYLNKQKVPHPFHFSPASVFSLGGEADFGTGFMLTYATESAIIADLVKAQNPAARAAILRFDGDAGLEFANGFKAGVGDSNVSIVAEESYKGSDPSVGAQMARIIAARPDVFLQFTAGKTISQVITALASANPPITDYLVSNGAVSANLEPAGLDKAEGVRAVVWTKDPSDPALASDEDIKLFQELVGKYGEGKDLNMSITAMYGFVGAELVVNALERSEPTPVAFLAAAKQFDRVSVPGMLPGVEANSGPGDPFMIESAREKTFTGGTWKLGDETFSFEGKTPRN